MRGIQFSNDSSGRIFSAGLLSMIMFFSVFSLILTAQSDIHTDLLDEDSGYDREMSTSRSASGWSAFGDSSSPANIADMAVVPSSGDIYISGQMSASSALSFGTQTASSSGTVQPWFAKSDSSGNWQWANAVPVSGGQYAESSVGGLAVSSNGDMYVTGMFYDNITFGSTNLQSTGYYDCFIAKANSNGQWQWAQALHGNGDYDGVSVTTLDVVWGTAIDVDTNGNAIIGGFFIGNTDVGVATDGGGTSGADAEVFVAKYSSSGSLQWTEDVDGANFQEVSAISVDNSGDTWIGTTVDGSLTFGSHTVTGTSGSDEGAFAKISSAGSWQSAKAINGGGDVRITGISQTTSGNLLMAGTLSSDASFGSTIISSAGGESDGWISSYDPSSASWDWANGIGGSSYDVITDVKAVSGGNGVVAMSSSSSFSIGPDTFSPQGFNDSLVAVFNGANGDWIRGVSAGSSQDDWPAGIGVSSAEQVVVAGLFAGTMDFSSTNSSTQTASGDFAPYVWAMSGILADDSDGDGIGDEEDNCPNDANPGQENHDSDAEGDVCDYDDDNDGVLDNSGDNCPMGEIGWVSESLEADPNASSDWDLDGCKDATEDSDMDNDLVNNSEDGCQRSAWDHQTLIKPVWTSNVTTDIDGDGCRDADEDDDDDNDGVLDGFDSCPTVAGTSSMGNHLGCPDDDGDGWSNVTDDCPLVNGTSNNGTKNGCLDTDGDGWADSEDALMYEPTQWVDSDGDGYGDNTEGFRADDCPNDHGTSIEDRWGCPDGDVDGYSAPDDFWTVSDGADAFDNISTQWADDDEDGYGDNYENQSWQQTRPSSWPGEYIYMAQFQDACPTQEGTSWQNDYFGCRDTDGDGWADEIDKFPFDETQWTDSDGDTYGDNLTGNNPDSCPLQSGNSTVDRTGCLDSDGDGYSDPDGITYNVNDGADAFRNDPTQWLDSDGDTFGNNPNGTEPDACPDQAGTSTKVGWLGCPPEVVKAAEEAEKEDSGSGNGFGSGSDEGGSMLYLIIGIVALVIVAAIVLLVLSRRGDEEESGWEKEGYATDAYTQAYGQQVAQEYAQPSASERMPTQTQAQVMMPTQPVQQAAPTADMVGQMRADGNEWMEYPPGAGMWYMRDAASRQWVRRI